MIRLKKREKISILLIAGTILTTGFPALKAKKETRIESFDFPSIWMDQRDAVLALIPSDKLVKDPDAQIWRTRGNAIKATVSSSFIAMRANVSRMSLAAAKALGFPFGPSGLT